MLPKFTALRLALYKSINFVLKFNSQSTIANISILYNLTKFIQLPFFYIMKQFHQPTGTNLKMCWVIELGAKHVALFHQENLAQHY
jgi:hypothetical protein